MVLDTQTDVDEAKDFIQAFYNQFAKASMHFSLMLQKPASLRKSNDKPDVVDDTCGVCCVDGLREDNEKIERKVELELMERSKVSTPKCWWFRVGGVSEKADVQEMLAERNQVVDLVNSQLNSEKPGGFIGEKIPGPKGWSLWNDQKKEHKEELCALLNGHFEGHCDEECRWLQKMYPIPV